MAPPIENPSKGQLPTGEKYRCNYFVRFASNGVPGYEHNPYTNQPGINSWSIVRYEFKVRGQKQPIIIYDESLDTSLRIEEGFNEDIFVEAYERLSLISTQASEFMSLSPELREFFIQEFKFIYFDLKLGNSYGSDQSYLYYYYLEQILLGELYQAGLELEAQQS